jgi:DNA-binding MarR family transcriptional regulator
MEKHNLVVRIPSKEDARKKLIYATKTGENLFLQMKPLMLSSLQVIQKGISEEEKNIFINVMKKIQTNLKINKN